MTVAGGMTVDWFALAVCVAALVGLLVCALELIAMWATR